MACYKNVNELLQAQVLVWKYSFSYTITASIKCVIQLGIPEMINQRHGQAITIAELVKSLKLNPSKTSHLFRIMRLLTHSGFFIRQQRKVGNDQEEEEAYTLTVAGQLLVKDSPLSMALYFHPSDLDPCESLVDWFRNDDLTAFHTASGRSFWDFVSEKPGYSQVFNHTMAKDSNLVNKALVSDKCRHVFEGLTSLVDVGGGIGAVARAIADAYPHIKCTVLDQQEVVADQLGTSNLDFIGGDLFDNIPSANAILLKWVLHNWNDEDCVKLLKKCKEAIPSKKDGGRVIIIETVIDTEKEDEDCARVQLSWDFQMMLLFAAKERTKQEWEKLFFEAGFSDYKIMPVFGPRSLIELYP